MNTSFPKVGWAERGYAPSQVDSFLNRAKRAYMANEESAVVTPEEAAGVSFSLVRRGYDTAAVDAALNRLYTALLQRSRAKILRTEGEQAWLDTAYEHARTLYPRLKRQNRAKFADAKRSGYEKDSVDAFLGRVNAYFDGRAELTADDVRNVIFPRAKKADAYREEVVDAYLDRLIFVLVSVE